MAAAAWHLPLLLPPATGRRRSIPHRAVALSSARITTPTTSTDELRAQLHQLQAEADTTRTKANSARLRLMRLTEAAEKLRRQAAVEVQVGREREAVELLLQKRKVMQALDKSKSRIQVLDKLSAKLNEAISVKETQLIGNVASDVEVDSDDSYPIRIVSPKDEASKGMREIEECDTEGIISVEEDRYGFQEEVLDIDTQNDDESPVIREAWKGDEGTDSLNSISSFEEFLEHLDMQLSKIEEELVTVLRFSGLVMGKDQLSNSFKVQETLKFLEDVKGIRERIASIREAKF